VSLIDSHAHLAFEPLEKDIDGVLTRAAEARVTHIITIGTHAADSTRSVRIAEAYPNVSATVGIHPHEAGKATDDDLACVEQLLAAPGVVAIGEIGLDYHYDFSDRASQLRVFRELLKLAAGSDLPLVIHCREATGDVVDALVSAGFEDRPVVFHCFTGTPEEADAITTRGWRLSFTGIVTFRNARVLREIARRYPADRLMLETDSPYLSPEPVRKIKVNEPAHLVHIARFVAALRSESLEQLAARTSANTRQFFRLA
jgi:TatD DNase family protein